ncbi:MAG TPA: FAD-dependent oxidoreductase [Solirubrobacteraceae bacterium]|nr:FAD-dependent oxidoreductase [Solirubrobacteraceae bacterium]
MSEVLVVGAGIVGAAVARELAVRGVAVTLVDRGEVSGGTTGLGEGNVLLSDKVAGPELELARVGRDLFAELEERMPRDARIRRKGALIVHPDEETWQAEPARLERMAVAEAELLDADAVRAAEPALTGEIHGASFFGGDLQCDPRRIARALAAEAAAAGAEVRTGCEVSAIEPGRGVRTRTGLVEAPTVVLAAGPWSGPLAASAGLRLPVEPRKGQLVKLAAPRPDLVRHKVVDGSYLASVASAHAGLELSTVVETTWEGDVLVGSSRERRGFDAGVDPEVSDAIVTRATRLFGELRSLPVVAAWSGLRPWLPDHLPAIGPSRAVPGLWVATGHEGAGVGLGPVTGRLVAQLFCGEEPVADPSPFDPDRFAGAR